MHTDRIWLTLKVEVIYTILQVKADARSEFCALLIDSYPKVLIENTSDEFWARGSF